MPERLEQAGGDALLAGRVRPHLLGAGARQQGGFGETPLEARVIGDGGAEAPLRGQLAGSTCATGLSAAGSIRSGAGPHDLGAPRSRVPPRDRRQLDLGQLDRRRFDVCRAHDELAILGLGRNHPPRRARLPARGDGRAPAIRTRLTAAAANPPVSASRRRAGSPQRAQGRRRGCARRSFRSRRAGGPDLALAQHAAVALEVGEDQKRWPGPLPASASTLAANSSSAPERTPLTLDSAGRNTNSTPLPARATGTPSRAPPISHASAVASQSPMRPPSQWA